MLNLIVISSDTWRADHLGCYGNSWIETPNIDQLAEEGVVFENFFAEALPTLPCRTAFYTGRNLWPGWQVQEHAGDHLGYQPGWHQIPEDWPTVAEVVSEAGYATSLVSDLYHQFKPTGNWHRGFFSWEWIRGQEQDRYITGPRDQVDLSAYMRPGTYERRRFQGLEQYLLNQLGRETEEDYLCARVFRRAADWLRDNTGNQPFLLWCECFDPHEPWDPPTEYTDRYCPGYEGPEFISPPGDTSKLSELELKRIKALYAGECTLVDAWIGHLLDTVREIGLWDETVIVFTTDHGTNLGERGYLAKRPWTLEHWEARLPLVVRHPDPSIAGKRIDALLQAPDLAPSLLGLLGQAVPPTMTGKDFWPAVAGEAGPVHDEVVSAYGPYAALRNHDWVYMARYSEELGRADRHPPRLVKAQDEEIDVTEEYPEVAAEMRERLRQLAGDAWTVVE